MPWSLGIPIGLVQKTSLSSVDAAVANVGGTWILRLSFCSSLEAFRWHQCSGKIWRGLKLPYQGEKKQKPLAVSPAGWKQPRNVLWFRIVRTGAQFSPLPRPDLKAQHPVHLGPDPQIYTQHLHPTDTEGSQTAGDPSWTHPVFWSPWSHAAKVSSFSTKPHGSRLNEAHTPRGQEQLHGAPSVHSFCGAASGGLHVNAPYLVESLYQFPYTILLCVYLLLNREYCASNNLLLAQLGAICIPQSGPRKSAVWEFFRWCFIPALPGRSTEPDFTSAGMSSASEMVLDSDCVF